MPKSEEKVWATGQEVKLKSLYEPLDGKVGVIARANGKWHYDVKIGNFTHLIHRDQLREVNE